MLKFARRWGIGSDYHVQTLWRVPLVRWAVLGALLLAEVLVLSVCFNFGAYRAAQTAPPDLGSEWWELVLWHAHTIIRLIIVGLTATALLFQDAVRRQLRRVAESSQPHRVGPLLLAHLGAFSALFYVSAQVVRPDLRASSVPGLWVALWLMTGLATMALWLAAALPATTRRPLARAAPGPLLVGAAVGAAALAAAWLARQAWRPLGQFTLWAVDRILSVSGANPMTDPGRMVVGTQRFSVEISPQCSGYEGIGLIWVFLAAYLFVFRRSLRFPRVLLLFPLGTLLMWVLNALRIAALIAVGTWLSPAIAVGGFHSYSGWLLFCGATLGLVAATQHSRFFLAPDVFRQAAPLTNPTAAYLAPLVVLVTAGMVTGAFSVGGFDALYALKVVAVGGTLWHFRREYRALRLTGSLAAVAAGVVVFALWTALELSRAGSESGDTLKAGLARLPSGVAGMWLAFRVVGSVVTVPIAEELAFRGYVMRRLIAADFEQVSFRQFSWLAFCGSSLLFGALHQRLLAGTVAGGVYALVLLRRGELSDAVVAHATTNAFLAAYVLIAGDWSLWA